MVLSPRFGLDDILGNETVDFAVLDANYDIIDAGAAHLALANIFANTQTIQRPAAGNPALSVRLVGDASPRLTITADGILQWPSASLTVGAGGALSVGGTTLTVPSVQAAPGTAAAPGYAFSSDTNTGLFSPSGDVLGIAVGGVETNRISSTGEIRFNRTNARILDGGGDDPITPGERLVAINALQVTPGRLHASGGISVSTLQVNNTATLSGAVTMSSTATVSGVLTVNSTLNAHGGRINFEGSNAVYIQWRGDLGALYIPYGNGIYTSHGRFTANVTIDGTSYHGRIVSGGWDVGWTNNFGGTAIAQNRFYQRGNGSYHCWDAGDFAFSSGINGSHLVQRSPQGYIYANYLNSTADQPGGRPALVAGQNGDGFMRWYNPNSIGPPASVLVFQANIAGAPGYNHGNWNQATMSVTETFDSIGINVGSGIAAHVPRSGWYGVYIVGETGNAQWAANGSAHWGVDVLVDGNAQGNRFPSSTLMPPEGGVSRPSGWWIGYLNAGQWIGARSWADRFGDSFSAGGRMEITFIPVSGYPNLT